MRGALALVVLAGCGDAVLVTVAGDREVPEELDAICLAVADVDPAGGHFGRAYQLEGALAGLPQTLAVEPGGASAAETWVRGFRGGVEVAGDRAALDFGGGVTLRLDRCDDAPGGAPAAVATVGPVDARLAISAGRGGALAIAIGGAPAIVDVVGGDLEVRELAAAAGAIGAIALDVDGDCDDDLAIWDGAEVRLLVRDVDDFTDAGVIATFAPRAAAAADVDRDGDQDLVLGAGDALRLYRAGADGLALDAAAIPGGAAADVTALAIGDVDGDGAPDLIVGQGDAAGAPMRALVSSDGVFAAAPAILPDVDLQVRDLALGDADGDGDLDLAVAVAGAGARLYVNRTGRLEDQTFVRLPQPVAVADAIALADWSGDCAPDLALAGGASQLLRGLDDGGFEVEAAGAAFAGDAAFADLDDDGDLDLVLATSGGVTWLRR